MKHQGGRRAVHQSGFSMVEILVALLIVLTSIMGVASLLVRTVQQELESSQRVEALVLLQDMVDRINANRQVAACYSNNDAGLTVGSGVANLPACNLGSVNQRALADADIGAWHESLQGATVVTTDGAQQGAMIGARGCIEQVSAAERIYRVTVAWQGMGPTVSPVNDCGRGEYGDDNLRRAITVTLRIGDLAA